MYVEYVVTWQELWWFFFRGSWSNRSLDIKVYLQWLKAFRWWDLGPVQWLAPMSVDTRGVASLCPGEAPRIGRVVRGDRAAAGLGLQMTSAFQHFWCFYFTPEQRREKLWSKISLSAPSLSPSQRAFLARNPRSAANNTWGSSLYVMWSGFTRDSWAYLQFA